MPMMADGILQAATVISKTTQTLVGAEISCSGYGWLTLHFTYTKGDETGLDILMTSRREKNGTDYAEYVWTASGGIYTAAAAKHRVTATGNYSITFDIRGLSFVTFTQGGSNNDGTPTGTLAASYTMKSDTD